jgi:hypothetical protein
VQRHRIGNVWFLVVALRCLFGAARLLDRVLQFQVI